MRKSEKLKRAYVFWGYVSAYSWIVFMMFSLFGLGYLALLFIGPDFGLDKPLVTFFIIGLTISKVSSEISDHLSLRFYRKWINIATCEFYGIRHQASA